jgi:hypothetical protein
MDAMTELMELVGSSGWMEGRGAKTIGRGKSKGMLMSCSPRPAMTIELGSCVRLYTVYAR